MKKNPKYALKHLSIRVPWHDNGWNGTICNNPSANGACLILKNCALNRNDEQEESLKGQSIEKMPQDQFPVCVGERGTFMAPFVFNKEINHPYTVSSPDTHGHLKPVTLRYPAYSASAVPYNWMLKENAEEKAEVFSLDYLPEREPTLKFRDSWIQELGNQKALLNCFFQHLEEKTSLVFLYAKQVPFYEGSGRVLVGVGRILHIEDSGEYSNTTKGSLRCGYWEHMIQHSIRKDFKDGFLLPYHEAIKHQTAHPEYDMSELAVITPQDKGIEFSFAAEHVSNDTSIRVLLQCLVSIEKAEKNNIGTNHAEIKQWIHDRIHELEKLRGDYPGMGAALCGFGIEKGHFVAAEIISSIKPGDNPWNVFLKLCDNQEGLISKETAKLIPDSTKRLYRMLRDAKDDSIELLHLLSRFDINQDQAKFLFNEDLRKKEGIKLSNKAFIENPYLLYEVTRLSTDPINITTIDFGLFLSSKDVELLPKTLKFSPEDYTNPSRIRAIIIQQLELASISGHTLLSQVELTDQILKLPIKPSCPVNPLYFKMTETIAEGGFDKVELKDGEPAYQLSRLAQMGKIIRDKVEEEATNARIPVTSDWRKLLDEELDKGNSKKLDETENRARVEKSAALKELAESRISVLIGPAGTGKTTLLTILSKHPDIKSKGIVFLAPTGKARVRMEQVARGLEIPAFTLAQFLNKLGRFDGKTQRYKLSNQKWENPCETVILDEASMLTEEMLSSLIDSFKNVKRFILVGDSRQLPPIGPGRPFIDVIQKLKPNSIDTQFPKVGSGYVELTIKRRFVGLNRQDIQLAEWFSGNALEPGEDHVINEVLNNSSTPTLRLVNWKNESDFEEIFKKVLIQELGLSNIEDIDKFNISLGSTPDGKWFNKNSAVNHIEDWQILSPVKEKTFGVRSINRVIHKLFRRSTIEWANKYYSGIPFPAGNEEIVYGDKVINLNNQTVWENKVWPKDGMNYIANGEIGIVTGQTAFKKGSGKPQNIHIEFSSQKGYQYSFWQSEFGEEGQPPLELAYAITVHKSQGSEFGKVFIVIPNPCFILSREMLYTALTRQKNKVVVLYQGNIQDIKKYSSPFYSDALGRITNLFENPSMQLIKDKFLEEHLIHMATDRELLRSKSELLIYQRLLDKGLQPQYELPLTLGGVIKFPDFTIDDKKTNKKYYWEHCGLLFDAEYKTRWEEKKEWYKSNGILPYEQGGGSNGTLIVSSDDPVSVEGEIRGAFSYVEIDQLIKKIFGK